MTVSSFHRDPTFSVRPEHPDKSLEATLFISVYVKRLQARRKDIPDLLALQQGVEAWQRSDDRKQLLLDYTRRGFALEDSANERRENGGKSQLKAGLFEVAAAKAKQKQKSR